MCLEYTTISINLKIKTNVEYIDKMKINMKYIDVHDPYNMIINLHNLLVQEIHARKVREVEELKEKVREELLASTSHLSQQLGLIDAFQHLGVAYHFEREIEEALKHIYATYNGSNNVEDDGIYNVALCFRLLRQQGFNVSCGEP